MQGTLAFQRGSEDWCKGPPTYFAVKKMLGLLYSMPNKSRHTNHDAVVLAVARELGQLYLKRCIDILGLQGGLCESRYSLADILQKRHTHSCSILHVLMTTFSVMTAAAFIGTSDGRKDKHNADHSPLDCLEMWKVSSWYAMLSSWKNMSAIIPKSHLCLIGTPNVSQEGILGVLIDEAQLFDESCIAFDTAI